eukprot:3436942-Rhodomonas_salina.1
MQCTALAEIQVVVEHAVRPTRAAILDVREIKHSARWQDAAQTKQYHCNNPEHRRQRWKVEWPNETYGRAIPPAPSAPLDRYLTIQPAQTRQALKESEECNDAQERLPEKDRNDRQRGIKWGNFAGATK